MVLCVVIGIDFRACLVKFERRRSTAKKQSMAEAPVRCVKVGSSKKQKNMAERAGFEPAEQV